MAKKERKLSIFEIVWYAVCGAVALWGLTYIVLGICARYLPDSNPLIGADAAFKKVFKLGFYYWGIIILVIATLAAIIVLLINAKKADRAYEKEQRRAARLASIRNSETPSVIDAEVEPVQAE